MQKNKTLRMDAIFLYFIFTNLEEGSNLGHSALWAASWTWASIGNERDGEDVNLGEPLSSLRNPANYQAITVTFQGIVEIDSRRNCRNSL
jgi:hypothetical protein